MNNPHFKPDRNAGANHPPTPLRSTSIPWWQRPLLSVNEAADVLACSRGQIYKLARPGSLSMAQNVGKTLVDTQSVLKQISRAQPFVPSGTDPRGAALVRARQRGTAT